MSFETYKKEMQDHFAKMTETTLRLFIVDTDPEEMWETYINGFPEKYNPIFRKRREHDCSCCRHFIKRFGNVVMIDEHFEMVSIWDFIPSDEKFEQVTGIMADLIHSRFIRDAFITQEKAFVIDKNWELLDGDEVHAWEHFYLEVPDRLRNTQGRATDSSIMGQLRANKEVLQRSFEEIGLDAVDTVLELIGQNSLYKGDEWKEVLLQFRNALYTFETEIADCNQDNYCWAISTIAGAVMSRIRNHSIGVLLTDISGGEDLDEAVRRYEKIVAPQN